MTKLWKQKTGKWLPQVKEGVGVGGKWAWLQKGNSKEPQW